MQRLFRAAESRGYLRQGLVTDKDGNPEVDANGTPTGRMDWVATGEDGFDGYLKWLGKTNSTAFVALIKSMVPHQVNVRTEKAEPEKYRTVEEVEADLRAGGYSDEKIAYLLSDLRPKKTVSDVGGGAVNGGPEAMPPSAALKQDVGGDYIDEDGVLRKG